VEVGASTISDPRVGAHRFFFLYVRPLSTGLVTLIFFFTIHGIFVLSDGPSLDWARVFEFFLMKIFTEFCFYDFFPLGVFVLSDDPSLDWVRDFEFFGKLPLFAKYFVLWGTICRHYLALQKSVTKNEKSVTKAVTDVGEDGDVCVW
jgi:hypothetical protein